MGDHVEEPELDFALGGNTQTAREVFDEISASYPGLANAEKTTPIKVALNQKMVDWDVTISDKDELAFLPPVTGG